MDIKLICAATLIFLSSCISKTFNHYEKDQIENYSAIEQIVADKDKKILVAIRSYKLNGENYFVVVDPDSLKTSRKNVADLKIKNDFERKDLADSEYFSMLRSFNLPPYDIAGYGLGFFEDMGDKKFLTIDMCPSKKPFEKEFFEKMVRISQFNNKPFPVGIAISGRWILEHEEEFEWILNNKKNLKIVWINHSFSHPYNSELANENNFLLMENINIENEVFELEKLLIENDQTPSIFFRFPGLISNQNLNNKINELGLIAISSDAWLAKGEEPSNGSIILIHGNSNEPEGIEKFNQITKEKVLTLLPLN